ncbi:MAG: hypothetical protein IK096_00685 [Lachnospiraceae bacterium]|nr:hypothetical protein [Lachnospiraceae bacterium]
MEQTNRTANLPAGMSYDGEGRICWQYDQEIRKHPMTLYIAEEMIFAGVITLTVIAFIGGGAKWALDVFLVFGGIFCMAGLIGWLIWSVFKKNTYTMTFAMNDESVVRTSPYGVTGYRDGNLYITRYPLVKRIRAVPEHDMVGVTGPWTFHQIYATPEQFDFLWNYMTARCTGAKVEK